LKPGFKNPKFFKAFFTAEGGEKRFEKTFPRRRRGKVFSNLK